jgi:4-aminobutyrate--pyruvate transaminase
MPNELRLNVPDNKALMNFTNLRQARTTRPMVLERGRGVFIIDENGREYLEGSSSFFCAALGFSERELVDAALRQMQALPAYATGIYRTTPAIMALAERLAALSPLPGTRVAFGATGSEANEFLLKFMRFRNIHRGEPQRRKMIARHGSYHGGTNATAALGNNPAVQAAFGIALDDVVNVRQPDFHNNGLPGESEAEFTARLLAELEAAIQAAGPETIGGMLIDPISYSAACAIPPPGYLDGVKRVLDGHGIPLFCDEVITGFGRTGHMFATETFGIAPTCITIAKALSSAYMPISAVLMSGDFYDELEAGSDAIGTFTHAGTYAGHPVAAAVALRMLELMEERDVLGHVRSVVPVLQAGLAAWRGHELVADVRGQGLGGAIQFKPQGTPGQVGARMTEALQDHGLILRVAGDSCVFSPPLVITAAEIAEMFQRFARAVEQMARAA